MFENLYRYSRVLARHLDGPAAEERDRSVANFAASGATRDSVSNLASEFLVVAQRLDVSGTRAVTPEESPRLPIVGFGITDDAAAASHPVAPESRASSHRLAEIHGAQAAEPPPMAT